jgi:alpha-mannosidase
VGAGDSEKLRWIALERLDKFVSSLYWTDVNLSRARCYPTAWRNARRPDYRRDFGVTLSVWSPPMSGEANHRFRVREALAASAAYRPCKVGDAFGPSWATHWFRAEIEVPAEFAGREVHFLWDSDSEAMVWRDGEPVQGLTGGDGGDRRAEFVLTRRCKGAERVVLFVEMACNGMFGNSTGDSIAPANPARSFTVKQAEVSDFDRELFDFYWDFQTVHAIAKELPADAARARLALRVANSVVNLFDVNDRSTMARGAALLREFLAVPAGPAEVEGRVWAVGHCHIDTAWLWPYEETKRKCARSWATQLLLMEEFAEYRFACSQVASAQRVLSPARTVAHRGGPVCTSLLPRANRLSSTSGLRSTTRPSLLASKRP